MLRVSSFDSVISQTKVYQLLESFCSLNKCVFFSDGKDRELSIVNKLSYFGSSFRFWNSLPNHEKVNKRFFGTLNQKLFEKMIEIPLKHRATVPFYSTMIVSNFTWNKLKAVKFESQIICFSNVIKSKQRLNR